MKTPPPTSGHLPQIHLQTGFSIPDFANVDLGEEEHKMVAQLELSLASLDLRPEYAPTARWAPPPNARFATKSIGDSDVHLGEAGVGRIVAQLELSPDTLGRSFPLRYAAGAHAANPTEPT